MKNFLTSLLLLVSSAALAGVTSDPFTGTPILVGPGVTVFEAENFDKGGEGIAFHNPHPEVLPCGVGSACSCTQTSYRPDALPMCGNMPLVFITYPDTGLWAQYTIQVTEIGNYSVELLAAIGDPCCIGAAYHIELDGVKVTNSIPLGPKVTAGWGTFEWRGGVQLIPMVTGIHTLRIVVDKGWFNWDSVRITRGGWIDWIWTPIWRTQ